MEAFESFVALALEEEGFVVSGSLKFPVRRRTRRSQRAEYQSHGYEVDLVGARADRLVLATVKSYFGSRGVAAEDVKSHQGYRLLNDREIYDPVVAGATERFGYPLEQAELRLYVGKFAGQTSGLHEQEIRQWCADQYRGGGPIRVFNVQEVVERACRVAARTQYQDNPALVAIKVLDAAGVLNRDLTSAGIE